MLHRRKYHRLDLTFSSSTTALPRLPRLAKRGLAALAAGSVALACHGFAHADIYSYTDKEGVTHFTNKPAGNPNFRFYLKAKTGLAGAAARFASAYAGGDRAIDRYSRYDSWIREAAALYQIPEELVRAIIKCESDYNAGAVSPVGAQGLMQLMPGTALRMQVKDSFSPRENIFGGTRYLRVLANMFSGNLELTIAGYNAGEGAVMKYKGIPPYAETQDYVVRVLTYYRRYRTTKDVTVASANTTG